MTQEYLSLVAQMRWQAFGNSLRNRGQKLEAGAQVLVVVLESAIGLGIGIGMAAATHSLLKRGVNGVIPGLLDFIFFFWFYGPLLVEGSSPSMDFRLLARYPIPFRDYFLMSAVYGLLGPCALLSSGWLAGVWVGIALARPEWAMGAALWLGALAGISLLFNRALVSLLEPVLASRRGREMTLAFLILLAGCSQMFVYILLPRSGSGLVPGLIAILRYTLDALPPGVVSAGLMAQTGADAVKGMLSVMGYGVVGALVLRRQLWRSYRGEVVTDSPPPGTQVRPAPGWKLPGFDVATSAIIEKELRYAHGDYRSLLAYLAAPFMACIFAFKYGSSQTILPGAWAGPGLTFAGLAAYVLLASTQQLYNCFSYDVRGFQFWVLAPVRPEQILAGKNAAVGFQMAASYLAVTGILAVRGAIGGSLFVMVTAALVFAAFTMFGVGNLLSVRFPTPIDLGRLSSGKLSPVAVVLGVLIQSGIVGSLAFFFYMSRRWGSDWLPFGALLVLALIALKFYGYSLRAAARYLHLHSEEMTAALT